MRWCLIDYPGFNLRLARALCHEQPKAWRFDGRLFTTSARKFGPGIAAAFHRWRDISISCFASSLSKRSSTIKSGSAHDFRRASDDRECCEARAGSPSRADPNLIGLFPGSRRREMRKILPIMLAAARRIRDALPARAFRSGVGFDLVQRWRAKPADVRGLSDCRGNRRVHARPSGGRDATRPRRDRGLRHGHAAKRPTSDCRSCSFIAAWLTYVPARAVVKVKHLGMPNVLAGREVVPEFVQHRARPQAIADAVIPLMQAGAERERMLAEFDAAISSLGQKEASVTAAQALLGELGCG